MKRTLLLIGLVFAYALLQPKLETWLGVDLPSLTEEDVVAPEAPPADVVPGIETSNIDTETARSLPSTKSPGAEVPKTANGIDQTTTPPQLGELRDIGRNIYQSTAGLLYRSGSQEGHRIKHILRHHEDDSSRPVHGVFDGDRNEVFAVIDEAYLYTFDHGPPRVTTEKDDGRTIYRVDLGRRIGYVGGQKGRRDNYPAAQHVQLILDGKDVITAYPVRISHQGK